MGEVELRSPLDLAEERAHWYYDLPMPLVWDIAYTLRD